MQKKISSKINYLHVHSIRQGQPVFTMDNTPSKMIAITREEFLAACNRAICFEGDVEPDIALEYRIEQELFGEQQED